MIILLWSLIFILAAGGTAMAAHLFNDKVEAYGKEARLSPFFTGVVLSTFIVALPELVISIIATAKDYSSLVPTYVFGANLINLLLIPGILAVGAGQLKVQKESTFKQIPMLLATLVVLLVLSFDGTVSFWEGIVLLAAFALFAAARHSEYRQGLWDRIERLFSFGRSNSSLPAMLLWGAGLVVAAYFTVVGTLNIADYADTNPGYLAASLVALAVSAPEMVYAYHAAKKGNGDSALNVLMISTIVNSTLVLGIPALIKPLNIMDDALSIGSVFLLFDSLLFSLFMVQKRWSAYEGGLLILIYLLYLTQFLNPLFS